MIAVFKHEMRLLGHSMLSYVFGAFLLIFIGFGTMAYNINASIANFEYVLGFAAIVFIAIVPLLTMRIMAEERRQKTDQLLYALPISSSDIIIGKYLALCVLLAIPMVIVSAYPLIFTMFGEVYLPTSYGSLFGFFFLGLSLLSIGLFISSLTESQGMAAGITVVAILFNYFSTTLADFISATAIGSLIGLIVMVLLLALIVRFLTKSDFVAIGVAVVGMVALFLVFIFDNMLFESLLPNLMKTLSLFTRFQTYINGMFDLNSLAFNISVIIFCLFLAVQSFEKRRYNG